MKKYLLSSLLLLCIGTTNAQITITANDMPVVGDTLRYSAALAAGANLNLTNTGANIAWDYSNLVPALQGVDTYKLAATVSVAYAAVISPTAYGYKVADSLSVPGQALPVTVNNLYTFFNKKNNPSRYIAEGFGAFVNGVPTPAVYTNEDTIFTFPLNYNNADTTTFLLNVNVFGGLAHLKQVGTRMIKVDGWGTIKTPYHTTPVACLRVRTEIVEADTVVFGGQTMGFPRHTFDYQWLANNEHYPALWVSGNIVGTTETPTTVRYRDTKRNLVGVAQTTPRTMELRAFPNPALDGRVQLVVPSSWTSFQVEVYDIQGRKVKEVANTRQLDLSAQPSGRYLIRVLSGDKTGYAQAVR